MLPVTLLALAACTNKDGLTADTTDAGTPGTTDPWACVITEEAPPFSPQLGCEEDFLILASLPLDASIPGAQSVKTVIDRLDDNTLYFQNSKTYAIHWEFAFENLNVDSGKPPVPDLGTFNLTEYYSPERRFILGSVTHYEGRTSGPTRSPHTTRPHSR